MLVVYHITEKMDRYGIPYWTNWAQVQLQISPKIKGIRIVYNRIFSYKLTDLGVLYPLNEDLS